MKTRALVTSALIGAVVLLVVFAYFSLERVEAPRGSQAAAKKEAPAKRASDAAEQAAEEAAEVVIRRDEERQPQKASPKFSRPLPSDPFATVDRFLEKLEFANIAFNAPRAINVDDTAILQLVLSLATPIDKLKQMIEGVGEKEGARIRVSNRMEARLTGTNFAITAVTPEVQAVTRTDVTEWKWEVKPRSKGRQHLHLILSVLINVDDVPTLKAIRTFDKEIEVEVAWGQQVGSFLENNWQWLWAVVLVPVAGWLWRKMRGSKSSVSGSDR